MATPGQQLPPGFRFHPTDEELVVQYLRRRALSRPLPAAVIPDVHDAAVLDPWDLPGAGDGEAYFFSFRQLAAASGGGGWRRRRAGSGYWKATGAEKPVFLRGFGCGGGGGGGGQHLVGVKTTLLFLRAKPPSRTHWVMHEYRLAAAGAVAVAAAGQTKRGNHSCMAQPGEWVVCRIFLKNNRSSRRRAGDADGETPVTGVHGHRRRQPSPSPSSSSCVTAEVSDGEGEEEVSSGSINGAPSASQREA
uniref:NAC domain-containing protein n=1 Tax=Oryza barthii TaxID=65489 RepID=A0A0D3H8R0_9ORYZ